MQTVVRFRKPGEPWSVNNLPATVKGRIRLSATKRTWREAAFYAVWEGGLRGLHLGESNVEVSLPFRVNRRRDPHNYTSTTVKAIVDGLVQAGLWPDDNPDHVTILDPRLTVGDEVIVTITPRTRRAT